MKQYFPLYFPILLFCVILTSCSPSLVSVEIEKLVPAPKKIGLSDSVNIAIVANIYPDTRTDSLIKAKYPPDSSVVAKTAMALKESLEDTPMFSNYDFPVYNWEHAVSGYSKPALPMDEAKQIASTVLAQYLLTVDVASTNIWYEIGYSESLNATYACTVVPYELIFRIYDIQQGTIKDEQIVVDTARTEAYGYGKQTAIEMLKKLPTGEDAIFKAVAIGSKIYAKTFTPSWIKEFRYFYVDGYYDMDLAEEYVKDGNWTKAMEIWLKLVDSKNARQAAMARFNMAVGCEMMDDFDLAIEWLEKAREKNAEIYIEKYHELLKQRMAEKKEIDKSL